MREKPLPRQSQAPPERTAKSQVEQTAPDCHERALAFRAKGQLQKALADFDKAIELAPDFALAYSNRGLTYQDLGQYRQAMADFQKAVELAPTEYVPQLWLCKLTLESFAGFPRLELDFAPDQSRICILIGGNGSGKTRILQAIALSFGWLIARIRSASGQGKPIASKQIYNFANACQVRLKLCRQQDAQIQSEPLHWVFNRARQGRKSPYETRLQDLNALAQCYRQLPAAGSLPLLAYYPTERSVLDIPIRQGKKHVFERINGYDNSIGQQGIDFRLFFDWFEQRESAEQESAASFVVWQKLQQMLASNPALWQQIAQHLDSERDRQLTAVRRAISDFVPEFSNLRMERQPRKRMVVNIQHPTALDGQDHNLFAGDGTQVGGAVLVELEQLSQGQKLMIALVGDIARRLAMLNPGLANPLQGYGIVLIDEVELHLHPEWQHLMVRQLAKTFPHCQFILTTHSPMVASNTEGARIYNLDQNSQDGRLLPLEGLYGQDANTTLFDMGSLPRNRELHQKLSKLYEAIQDGKSRQAEKLLHDLLQKFPGNLELAKASILQDKIQIRKKETEQSCR